MRDSTGQEHFAILRDEEALSKHDVALLEINTLRLQPLPVDSRTEYPHAFKSRGYFYGDRGFKDAITVEGIVTGISQISYEDGDYPPLDVWTLGGLAFDKGISGAPLVDAATGVVTAIVNARFKPSGGVTGTAIPLRASALASPSLAEALKENRRSVSAFGQYVNASGARELCRRQAAAAVNALSERGVYLPLQYCDRVEPSEMIAAFRHKAVRVLPVVGPAGTGKTSILANVGVNSKGDAVLLRGVDIRDDHAHLGEQLAASLRAAHTDDTPTTGIDAVLSALEEERVPLLILLDGLNESRLSPAELVARWIPDTCAWLKERNARLVISCRHEFWKRVQSAFNHDLLFKGQDKGGLCSVGEFSGKELLAAAVAYELPLRDLKRSKFFRHPLTLRLHWRLTHSTSKRADYQPFLRQALFNSYIDDICSAAANYTMPSPTVARIRAMVGEVARRMLMERSSSLSRDVFDAAFRDAPQIASELERENLFEEADGSYRFTFDEIGEYLQASLPDVSQLDDDNVLTSIGESGKPFSSSIAAQVLALGESSNPAAVHHVLRRLVDLSNDEYSLLPPVAYRFLALSASPRAYLEEFRELVSRAATATDTSLGYIEAAEAIADIEWPTDVALQLIRELALRQEGYFWRDKDRQRGDFAQIANPGFGRAIRETVERQPSEALRGFAGWVGDASPLKGLEGSVGELAGIVLERYRTLWDDDLIDFLGLDRSWRAGSLLVAMADREPRAVVRACNRWIATGDVNLRSRCIDLANAVGQSDRVLQRSILGVLLQSTVDQSERTLIARSLLLSGDHHREIWVEVLDGYDRGEVSLYDALRGPAGTWPDLRDRLIKKVSEESASASALQIQSLGGFPGDLQFHRDVADLLTQFLARDSKNSFEVARVLEEDIYKLDGATLQQSGLLAVAMRLALDTNAAARRCIAYAALSARIPGPVGPGVDGLRTALLAHAVTAGEEASFISIAFADNDIALGKYVLNALSVIAPDKLERALLEALASTFQGFDPTEWLRDHPQYRSKYFDEILAEPESDLSLRERARRSLLRGMAERAAT